MIPNIAEMHKALRKVANFLFLYMSYLMLTFIPHMGVTFSKEKENTIFLLIISKWFRFVSELHCLWSLGNKGIQTFYAWSYCCGNPLFHPLKKWINNWTNLKSFTTCDSYKHLKTPHCLIYFVCNSITNSLQYINQNIVKEVCTVFKHDQSKDF